MSPAIQLVEVEGAGHFVHIDRPDAVVAAVEAANSHERARRAACRVPRAERRRRTMAGRRRHRRRLCRRRRATRADRGCRVISPCASRPSTSTPGSPTASSARASTRRRVSCSRACSKAPIRSTGSCSATRTTTRCGSIRPSACSRSPVSTCGSSTFCTSHAPRPTHTTARASTSSAPGSGTPRPCRIRSRRPIARASSATGLQCSAARAQSQGPTPSRFSAPAQRSPPPSTPPLLEAALAELDQQGSRTVGAPARQRPRPRRRLRRGR